MNNFTQLNNYTKTSFDLNDFINKIPNEKLTLDDILDDNDAVQEFKSNEDFELIEFLSPRVIRQLIEYAITMPEKDELKIGYKFPFNACEILCCGNNTIIELLVKEINNTKKQCEKKIQNKESEEKDKKTILHSLNMEDQNDNDTLLKKEEQVNNDDLLLLDNHQKKEEENKNEDIEEEELYILDYLFTFIRSSIDNDNYVLSGYFYKLIIHFLDINPSIVLKYLYEEHPEHLKNCIKILKKKSIGDLVLKILTYEDSFPKYDTQKIELLTSIIIELNQSQDSELYEYTMDMLGNAILIPKMFDLLLESSHLLELLYTIMSNNTISNPLFNPICNFLIKLNNILLSSFPIQVTQNLQLEPSTLLGNTPQNKDFLINDDIEQESSLVFNLKFVFNLLKETNFSFLRDLGSFDNMNDELESTYCQKQKRLGMKKLIQAEYVKSILEIIINSNAKNYYKEDIIILIQEMIRAKVFQNLIDIFFKFDMNNLYQTYFQQIISISINEYSPIELVEYLFDIESINFNSLLIDNIVNNHNFDYNSKRKINSCSFSVMMAIYNDIMNSSNAKLKELLSNQRNTIAFNEIVTLRIMAVYNKKLLLSESGTSFFSHFDSGHKEEDNVKYSLYSLREILEQHLSIYDEYKKGHDYKQLLFAKILKEKESMIELDDNLNINLEMNVNDENIFEKRVSFENKNNELFFVSSDGDFSETNIPFQIIPDVLMEKQPKNIAVQKKEEEEYYDNHYWKSASADEDLLSSLLKELDL